MCIARFSIVEEVAVFFGIFSVNLKIFAYDLVCGVLARNTREMNFIRESILIAHQYFSQVVVSFRKQGFVAVQAIELKLFPYWNIEIGMFNHCVIPKFGMQHN